jgi:tRNA(Ile)-lysidine synthase
MRANLSAKALALAQRLPRARLHPAVLAWADGTMRRGTWNVALSGGADSLALLLLLWAHWPERRARLRALHFNHRLRGRAAGADVRFCRAVCRALGVELIAGAWTRPRRARAASEAEARAARMAFFARQRGALWLGHQQDDIAETLLMRIARGSGTGGLAAPRPVQEFADGRVHLRPLLTLKKRELAAALRAVGVAWREDETNAGDRYLRNRLRQRVVRRWAAAGGDRDALAGAARTRTLLEEDDAALEAWAAELATIDRSGALPLAALAGQPRAVLRRVLHRWVLAQRRTIDVSSQAFEALLAALQAGKPTRHSIGRELLAEIAGGVLRVAPVRSLRGGRRRRPN